MKVVCVRPRGMRSRVGPDSWLLLADTALSGWLVLGVGETKAWKLNSFAPLVTASGVS